MKTKSLIILVLAIVTGCAWTKKEPTDSQNLYEAQNIINEMFENYKNYIPGYLDPYVSNDFTPNRYEYISNISKSAADEHVLELSAVTYKADRKDDVMTVRFKWSKKRNKYSKVSVDSITGSTDFVFKQYKKRWLLISATGDDPFVN